MNTVKSDPGIFHNEFASITSSFHRIESWFLLSVDHLCFSCETESLLIPRGTSLNHHHSQSDVFRNYPEYQSSHVSWLNIISITNLTVLKINHFKFVPFIFLLYKFKLPVSWEHGAEIKLQSSRFRRICRNKTRFRRLVPFQTVKFFRIAWSISIISGSRAALTCNRAVSVQLPETATLCNQRLLPLLVRLTSSFSPTTASPLTSWETPRGF